MRPAKEFPAAREHFGETKQATLDFFFPFNFCDAISTAEPAIEPRAYHTGQAFYLFQNSPVLPLLCNNNSITRGP